MAFEQQREEDRDNEPQRNIDAIREQQGRDDIRAHRCEEAENGNI